jgi:hypothetical protein
MAPCGFQGIDVFALLDEAARAVGGSKDPCVALDASVIWDAPSKKTHIESYCTSLVSDRRPHVVVRCDINLRQ